MDTMSARVLEDLHALYGTANGYDAHLEWLYVQEFGIVPDGARFVVDVELVEDEQGAYYEAILRDPNEVERLQ